jgi:hypothetical protein
MEAHRDLTSRPDHAPSVAGAAYSIVMLDARRRRDRRGGRSHGVSAAGRDLRCVECHREPHDEERFRVYLTIDDEVGVLPGVRRAELGRRR